MRIGKVTFNLEAVRGMTKEQFATIANEGAMGISVDMAWGILNPSPTEAKPVVKRKSRRG